MMKVPILRTYAVMRKEFFGGFLMNPFLPPEIVLDHVRFRIVNLCNGNNTVEEIKAQIETRLDHSAEYIDHIVRTTLDQLESRLLLYWRKRKLERPLNLIDERDSVSEKPARLSAPVGVIWELTRSCNLRCKHCFSDSGRADLDELSTEEIIRVIDTFSQGKVLYINFTGGEPLLRTDLIEILRHASSKGISIDLSTNGFLINERIVEALQDTNVFQVQLSIDGLGPEHDRFRGVAGCFDLAMRAIGLLRQAGFKVVISTTLNKTNAAQISELVEMAMNVGASGFKTTLFLPVGRGEGSFMELSLNENDVRKLAETLIHKKRKLEDRFFLDLGSCYPWLLEKAAKVESPWRLPSNLGCAAGRSSIFVTADGYVTPCPFLRQLVVGNLREDTLNMIWRSDAWGIFRDVRAGDFKGKCGNCDYLGVECYGGCRAAALAYSGDLYAEDPLCWKGNTTDTYKLVR